MSEKQEINIACNICSHRNVCRFAEVYYEFSRKISEVGTSLERDNFNVCISCKYFDRSKPLTRNSSISEIYAHDHWGSKKGDKNDNDA